MHQTSVLSKGSREQSLGCVGGQGCLLHETEPGVTCIGGLNRNGCVLPDRADEFRQRQVAFTWIQPAATGFDAHIVTASLKAVISAYNRASR